MRSTTAYTPVSIMKNACPMSQEERQLRRAQQQLCFGDVKIREFPLIMGDNPHCVGAPLQLNWTPSNESCLDIDMYEYTRSPRRSKKKMHMAGVDREIYLLSIGYSMNEIINASEMGKKIRKERLSSFQNKKWDRFNVVLESAKEKLAPRTHIVSAKTA